MGEIADYYFDKLIDSDRSFLIKNSIPKNSNENIWLTSSGEEIKVKNMSDSHIKNALNCILEDRIKFDSSFEVNFWIKIFEDELKLRNIK